MADEKDLKDALSGEKDLASFDLSGADLSGHDFAGCNFDNCNLRNANLSDANLEACDLRSATIHGVNFSKSNLTSAKFMWAISGVIFSHSNLSNAMLNTCTFIGCNFNEAILDNADFSESVFQEGNTFVDAKVNSNTKFNHVQMHRSLSKDSVFSEYEYSRGHLHARKTDSGSVNGAALSSTAVNAEEINQETISTPITEKKTQKEAVDFKVGQRLAAKPVAYSAQLNELAEWMSEQVAWWESKKPNQDDAEWTKHYEFLKSATSTLSELSETVASLSGQTTSTEIEQAGNSAIVVQSNFEKWLDDFSGFVSSTGKSVGMLSVITGATYAVSAITGVDTNMTFGVVTAAIGGRDLAENIGKAIGKS
ncbi:pentapeptide repeat-containing protein [Ahrensia sp. 13_GOM-1096m]|uniref:pentapeptide repeat-containing protein n=1 Tax=Ahrensia sp. 13_GOM-1096m TaxID=1380380 RepID=UPI000688049F|nr:pentapeptide repeat-containing protein [Ahrensia sp. 13_GOM-1096m]